MSASNVRSCDNERASNEATPAGNRGLTAGKERLMQDSTRSVPGDQVRSSLDLDQWRGADVDPFGGAA